MWSTENLLPLSWKAAVVPTEHLSGGTDEGHDKPLDNASQE
jgi:hypothetical protein